MVELDVASKNIMTLVPYIVVFSSRDCIEFRTSDMVECPFTMN